MTTVPIPSLSPTRTVPWIAILALVVGTLALVVGLNARSALDAAATGAGTGTTSNATLALGEYASSVPSSEATKAEGARRAQRADRAEYRAADPSWRFDEATERAILRVRKAG